MDLILRHFCPILILFGPIEGDLGLDLTILGLFPRSGPGFWPFWVYFRGSWCGFRQFWVYFRGLGLDLYHFRPIPGGLGMDLDHFGPVSEDMGLELKQFFLIWGSGP